MKPRERIIAALDHRESDFVPTGENHVDGNLVEQILDRPTLYNMGWKEIEAIWDGRRNEVVHDYCTVHVGLVHALNWDYVRVPIVPADIEYHRPEMTGPYSWIDSQGFEVQCNPEAGNILRRTHYPDMNIDDLPDPDEPFTVDSSELEAIRHVVEELGETHFIIARSSLDGSFPWEQTVGMEEFLVRMVTDPEFVRRAVDTYVNRSICYFHAMLDAGVDGIMTLADYSDNRGPIMGSELFRRFILPGIERQCEAIHGRGGYMIKHTDGNIWDILDCLVDIGIDAWHGIQRNIGMDMGLLKDRYGEKLCFFGGVNCETLIDGTEEEAREEVRSAIKEAGHGGGLVVTSSNVIPPGARLANYYAARQAVRDYGTYPLE